MLFFLAQVGVIDPRKPPAGWYVRICTGRGANNLEIKLEIDFDFFSVDFLCHMSFGQLLHSSVRPRCCGWADESSSPFDLWSIFCVFSDHCCHFCHLITFWKSISCYCFWFSDDHFQITNVTFIFPHRLTGIRLLLLLSCSVSLWLESAQRSLERKDDGGE